MEEDLFDREPGRGERSGPGSMADRRKMPLAARMRPRSITEVVGQDHLFGKTALLPRLIETNQFGSLLFHGPPGCGKTSLAEVIAVETGARFVRINAVLSNVAELRDVLKMARYREESTILFIDEIHRFNRAQQDLLLPDIEAGNLRLIGATTHNPGFSIIAPLVSRSHLFRLNPVPAAGVVSVLERALRDEERGLGHSRVEAEPGVLEAIARIADGDLRRALNALETLVLSQPVGTCLSGAEVEAFAKERHIRYDANEDEHYDTASAFIKSLRGGDPDAAVYWLAKQLIGGEDPRFIARRLVIFASEDVGMADSRALPVAMAAFQACEVIGLPECELNLAHATVFLATCPKSNSTCLALAAAKASIRKDGLQPVPVWLRDKHGAANRAEGNSRDYLYSHDYPEAISGQDYLVKPLQFYRPKDAGSEAAVRQRLERWQALKAKRERESGT